jgi:hypothetical protein
VKSRYPNEKNQSERGKCKLLDPEGKILGKACNSFYFEETGRGQERQKTPLKGYNEKLVCGLSVFDNTGVFEFYEWLGYCKQGHCKVCASFGPEFSQTLSYMLETEPGSLLCPGRSCVGSDLLTAEYAKEQEERSIQNYFSVKNPDQINAAILSFVIVITLANLTMCLCSIRQGLSPRKYKRVSQTL